MSQSQRSETCPVCGTPDVVVHLSGRKLRKARLRAGTSLRAMAKELGISAPYLVDIELDRRPLRAASPLAEKVRSVYPDGAV